MEAGRVVEQGAPAELLARPGSRFAAMLRTLEGGSGGGSEGSSEGQA